jgi:TolB-like protein/cytochrome c-type biogenesis protein CcmH/NrfG
MSEQSESRPGSPPTTPASREVFVSYASQDSAVALAVVEALEHHGLSCWIAPRDVTPGALYADGIIRAITAARAVVLVLSESALASPHVGKEVERASSKRRPIITVRIDAAQLSPAFEYFLSESQWIEAPAGDVQAVCRKLIDALTAQPAPASAIGSPAPAKSSAGRPVRRAIAVIALAGSFIAAVGYLAMDKFRAPQRGAEEKIDAIAAASDKPAATSDKSVAVLPFVDMSEKKDQEYFSDGLSEELIDMLAKVPDLRVPARTSSFFFKGKQTSVADIAKALAVTHVLEGSVRKAGDRVRITAQLIRVDNGYHIWSETYDRQLDDIFKVQDEIATAVVKALKASLLAGEPLHAATTSVEAYTLLLQAGYFVRQVGGFEANKKAVDYYEQSLRLDPVSAAAWAGLSRALTALWSEGVSPQQALYRERAIHAAERALALDPKSADAHIALGKLRLVCDWNWVAADAEFKQARSLDARDSYANYFSGELAYTLGRTEEALDFYRRAIDQDPVNVNAFSSLASLYEALGRHQEAQAAAHKVLELNPDFGGIRMSIGLWKLRAGGEPAAALEEIKLERDDQNRSWGLAYAYAMLKRDTEAEAALKHYQSAYGANDPVGVAQLYSVRGSADRTFGWLDRAYDQHDPGLANIKMSVSLEGVHSDPRYAAFLRKMNLPE